MWQDFGNRGGEWAVGETCAHRAQQCPMSEQHRSSCGPPPRGPRGWAPWYKAVSERCQQTCRLREAHTESDREGRHAVGGI